MSNLKLVPDLPTPLEKLLLDASRAELPSDDHKTKLRAALGLGLPMSGLVSSPPPAATLPTNAQTAQVAAPGASGAAKSALLGKLALGVALVAVLAAVLLTRKPTAVVAPPAAAPAVPEKVVAAPVAGGVEAAPVVSPLPPVEQAATSPSAAPATRVRADASAGTAVDLSEQIRLIEAARSGVASHDAKTALAALDGYAAKFPHGSFGQEATVLRIRALDQSGDSARASAMAKSFIARFPNSPHVARLKPIAERGASR